MKYKAKTYALGFLALFKELDACRQLLIFILTGSILGHFGSFGKAKCGAHIERIGQRNDKTRFLWGPKKELEIQNFSLNINRLYCNLQKFFAGK